MSGQPTLFLDRDGVVTTEGGEYVTDPDALRLLPGAAEAIARLAAAGWRLFLFTNQAGVGKGYLTLERLKAIHRRLTETLEAAGGRLNGIYFCPHHPDAGCDCRKPLPGMLFRAAAEHGLDLSACTVVGDSPRDIAAGHAAGCRTVLVLTGHTPCFDPVTFPAPHPDSVLPDLTAVADILCTE